MLDGVGLFAGFQLQRNNPIYWLFALAMDPDTRGHINLPFQAKPRRPDVLLDVRKICDCHSTGHILFAQSSVTGANNSQYKKK